MTNIAIAEKDVELAKGTLQPSLSAFYGYNTRVSYADRVTGDGNFTDVPIGFVSSTKNSLLIYGSGFISTKKNKITELQIGLARENKQNIAAQAHEIVR